MSNTNLELERKFLVKPEYVNEIKRNSIQRQYIKQTYLSFDPELRVRKIINAVDNTIKYTLTAKRNKEIGKIEKEFEIKLSTYLDLYKNKESEDLYKTRYIIPLAHCLSEESMNGLVGEMDVYRDFDIVVIEVEFPSILAMMSFIPPNWFGKEVTFDSDFGNKTLIKRLSKMETK